VSLRTWGDVLLLVGWGLPAVAAPLEYAFVRDDDGRRLGFRRSALGRHLMSYMLALAFVALLGAWRILFGGGTAWEVARIVAYVGVAFVAWWRWRVVHLARVASESERASESPLAP
jgi:hypothetical protein